jgi:hypothetical protein
VKYVIACNHEYYATVEFRETREDADALAAEWVREGLAGNMGNSYYGRTKVVVVVAEVLSSSPLPQTDLSGA